MTAANIAYLIMVLTGFAAFVCVLGGATVYVRLGDRARAKRHPAAAE
jgi:uncharacterized membrane protein